GHKRYKEALEIGNQLLALDPQSLEAQTIRYEAYKGLGDQAKAKEAFAAMSASNPGQTADSFFKQGVALFNANNIEQARAAFERVLAADPNHAKAHYMLGLSYANAGDTG